MGRQYLDHPKNNTKAAPEEEMDDREQAPQFPIRIIFDDGACEFIDTPDDLHAKLYSFDSADPKIWIRDNDDRTVKLHMMEGQIRVLRVAD